MRLPPAIVGLQIRCAELKFNEKIHIHGLRTFMDNHPEVSVGEIKNIIKEHPLKFSVLKRLSKEQSSLVEDLSEHGYWFICVKIEQDRSIKKKNQQMDTIRY